MFHGPHKSPASYKPATFRTKAGLLPKHGSKIGLFSMCPIGNIWLQVSKYTGFCRAVLSFLVDFTGIGLFCYVLHYSSIA